MFALNKAGETYFSKKKGGRPRRRVDVLFPSGSISMGDNLCVAMLQRLSQQPPSPGHGQMSRTASTPLPAGSPRPATGL
jgi:hypothetical protein